MSGEAVTSAPPISPDRPTAPGKLRFAGPRMVLVAFLMKNLAVGLSYGTFGALLAETVVRFHAPLSVVSLGLPLVVLAGGLLAPVAAYLMRKLSIRTVMLLGVVLGAAGYACAGLANGVVELLLCYGLLIGPGVAFMGLLPCYVLVSNWYVRGQGRAIGLVEMPLGVMLMPPLATAFASTLAYPKLMFVLAAGYLVAVPLAFLVVDKPEAIGQTALGAESVEGALAQAPGQSVAELIRRPSFLLLLIGYVATIGPAVTVSVHLIPILGERGLHPAEAAALLSIYGGAAAAGSLVYGWLADRLGPTASLLLNAISQAAGWGAIFSLGSLWPLAVAAGVVGAGVGGASVALSVLLTRLYGAVNLGRALALLNFGGLPIVFLSAPLTAAVREKTGSYDPAIAAFVIALAAAGACWFFAGGRRPSAVALDARLL